MFSPCFLLDLESFFTSLLLVLEAIGGLLHGTTLLNPFLSCLRPAFKVEVCQPFYTLRNHNNFARSIWAMRSIKKANYLSHWDVVSGKPFFCTCGTPWSVFLVEGRGSRG
jgi:hypothetical protein